jgi:hypothetical protein
MPFASGFADGALLIARIGGVNQVLAEDEAGDGSRCCWSTLYGRDRTLEAEETMCTTGRPGLAGRP